MGEEEILIMSLGWVFGVLVGWNRFATKNTMTNFTSLTLSLLPRTDFKGRLFIHSPAGWSQKYHVMFDGFYSSLVLDARDEIKQWNIIIKISHFNFIWSLLVIFW